MPGRVVSRRVVSCRVRCPSGRPVTRRYQTAKVGGNEEEEEEEAEEDEGEEEEEEEEEE
jgi:hypothetical protein